ncbi:hypothetical protein FA09DRAFT_327800 [Tilletiopsis washingtonensis]|uniref:Uncharacterized protein n=1 Tax=Tilletiopsis washingtonensis TaxID=58919 RepID=A0A316ZGG7_9BASI|nr:hypothetical protein FA09DRAFT_327800 [Tilletiopsis washingtonensis]PWO00347.1 hypothetical protein FA09DRAFT_327800 [Tilletiopsis washingtonensis]
MTEDKGLPLADPTLASDGLDHAVASAWPQQGKATLDTCPWHIVCLSPSGQGVPRGLEGRGSACMPSLPVVNGHGARAAPGAPRSAARNSTPHTRAPALGPRR